MTEVISKVQMFAMEIERQTPFAIIGDFNFDASQLENTNHYLSIIEKIWSDHKIFFVFSPKKTS